MNPFRSPKRIAVVAGTLLVMAGSIWAVWHFWPNRHLARAQELRGQLAGDAGRSLSAEERRELWSQLRAEAKKLSPEERRNLWRATAILHLAGAMTKPDNQVRNPNSGLPLGISIPHRTSVNPSGVLKNGHFFQNHTSEMRQEAVRAPSDLMREGLKR